MPTPGHLREQQALHLLGGGRGDGGGPLPRRLTGSDVTEVRSDDGWRLKPRESSIGDTRHHPRRTQPGIPPSPRGMERSDRRRSSSMPADEHAKRATAAFGGERFEVARWRTFRCARPGSESSLGPNEPPAGSVPPTRLPPRSSAGRQWHDNLPAPRPRWWWVGREDLRSGARESPGGKGGASGINREAPHSLVPAVRVEAVPAPDPDVARKQRFTYVTTGRRTVVCTKVAP